MAEQREQVILEADARPAVAAAKEGNKGFEDYEKGAGKANKGVARSFDAAEKVIVRASDRSRTSIERMIAAAERKGAFAGLDKSTQLLMERDQLLKRIGGGEAEATNRIRAAYEN